MKTIIDTALDAGKFTTLLSALKTASLTDTLRAQGPYTVLAPTDEAFKRLPAGSLDALLRDPRKLKTLLTRHVLSGSVKAKDISPREIKTLEGSTVTASLKGSDVYFGDAKVVQADIAASNGVIHAIDTVIMPKSEPLAAVA